MRSLAEFRARVLSDDHTRGADGYAPAPLDGEGFQLSTVFAVSFRLERRRDARSRWVFNLQSQPCQRWRRLRFATFARDEKETSLICGFP